MISFRRIILIITVLTAFVYSNKSFASIQSSTNIRPKPWKVTEQQFLNKYGKDDSSRALIHYYFERRKVYKNRTILFTGISGVSGILFGALIERPGVSALGAILLGIPLLVGLWFFGFAIIIEAVRWIRTSRKALFKMLKNFENEKRIPKRISSNRRFQNF